MSQVDLGSGKLRSTSDLADKVIPALSTSGSREIRENLEHSRKRLDDLKKGLASSKAELETSIGQLTQFERSLQQLSNWVKDTEIQVRSDTDLKTDLPEKKAHMEKFKVRET